MSVAFTSEEELTLLKIARDAIHARVNHTEASKPNPPEPALNRPCGCFVTITRSGRLRGCIGTFSSDRPLYQEVAQMAVAAATTDPRFAPMQPEELVDIQLEISVLSPLRKIRETDSIKIGTHGIYLQRGEQRGVLLPQVAVEYGWDRDTFLQQTCRKAGLAANAWQAPDTDIFIFSATIISEQSETSED